MPRAVLNPELMVSTSQPRDVGGRPTSFKIAMIKTVYELSLLGCTEKQMSVALGIPLTTFIQWKNDNERFSYAIRAGKDGADGKVARKIYEQACEGSLPHQRWWMSVRRRGEWPLIDERTGAVNVTIGSQQPAVAIDETDPREAMKAYQAMITGQPFVPSPRSIARPVIDVEPSE